MSRTYVIRTWGVAGMPPAGEPHVAGQYLVSSDVDAFDGRGHADWTVDRAKARRFASPVEATEEWRRQSTVRPLRPDGKPNRPLSSYTVEIVPLEGAEGP